MGAGMAKPVGHSGSNRICKYLVDRSFESLFLTVFPYKASCHNISVIVISLEQLFPPNRGYLESHVHLL